MSLTEWNKGHWIIFNIWCKFNGSLQQWILYKKVKNTCHFHTWNLLKYPTSQTYTHKLITYIQGATYKTYIDFTLLLPVHVSLKAADLLPPGCYNELTNCRKKDSDILKAEWFFMKLLSLMWSMRKETILLQGTCFLKDIILKPYLSPVSIW